MPKVVAEGRRVINNIKNSSSLYLMKTLFTAFLAFICICMKTPYLFLPQNMLLLETAIIAIPSFFLSLQPNKDRVQGKFISHVMSGAISGAVLMILNVMAMYLTNVIDPDEFGQHYLAMCMMAMTFSGFVMVFRTCQPLNVYRTTLCLVVFGLCVMGYAVPWITEHLLYKGWTDLEWDYAKILTIVVAIEASFYVSKWLIELMHIIMPSTDTKKQIKKNT